MSSHRARSRSPTRDGRQGERRYRSRSPTASNARQPVPATPYANRVDAYGIPIYPLEPEPQATMYGRDMYGEVVRPNQQKAGPKYRNPDGKPRRSYPSVPDFRTIDLSPIVAEAISRTTGRRLDKSVGDIGNVTTGGLDKKSSQTLQKSTDHGRDVSSTRSTSSTLLSKDESVLTLASTQTSANETPKPSVLKGALQDITNKSKVSTTNVKQAAKKPETIAAATETTNNKSSSFFDNDDLIDLSDYGSTQQQAPVPSKVPKEEDPWAITPRPGQLLRDPYDILGIQWGASIDDILAAYESLILEIELDRLSSNQNPVNDAKYEERMAEVNAARLRLLNY